MSKLTPAEIARFVADRTGAHNDDLLAGPAAGEDAAAIRGREGTLVVSSDPVSLAADRIGEIGVAVATNDVAASGGFPEYLVSTVLLPEMDTDVLDAVTGQLDRAAERLGVTIVGGHTESVSGLARPLLSLTCLGYADRYVPTGGASPGDRLLLTKGAGIEATAILASDFAEAVRAGASGNADGLDGDLAAAEGYFDDLSVLPEAAVLAPAASAMHDSTEGGVLGGLVELATASGVDLTVDRDQVPVRGPTERLCGAMDLDPLSVLGSGALLAAVPEAEAGECLDALANEDIEAADIGLVEADSDDPSVTIDGERHTGFVEDGMYALWE